ncbi:MarR family winged helix-turn-helix transcriptional regulator [Actinomadura namibiensis]|uniref:DNA-binding MarR family transcriptional regulator n=1 Tax=Actinomadura namibiensis TaxID=182080 RepID=A0A7W3LPY5_ACTNM|nr:MarR family transcriptional regulator [Actinomadura namibiensis]MBA8952191.1 DNA-binding MarR family transcriptional regulator [Actinomadura namibiensis]
MNGVLRAIRELHTETEALFDAVAERYGLNRNDLRCLELLQREGEMRAQRLAVLSHLSPAAVTKVVDRLVAAGYATRRQSAEDRRAQIIGVSERHADLRAVIWDPVHDDAVAVLESVSPQELHAVASVIHRLAEVNRTHALRNSASPEGDTGDRPGGAAAPGR